MKKNYLLIIVLFIGFVSNAQQIPNGNFEQWHYDSSNLSFEPVGWRTANLGLYDDTTVRRYQPAHSGNYACGLFTDFILGTFPSPGFLTTTFPINSIPSKMQGYFKGNLAMDDTTIIIIEFNKDTNVIADGIFYLTQSQANYIKFEVIIDYFGTGNPDSCTISMMNSGFELADTLTGIAIDDLSFVYPVNVKNTFYTPTSNLQLYPNPASENLHILCDDNFQSMVIFNATGQIVNTYRKETSISIAEFSNGIYFIQLLDENRQVVAKKSFIKN